MKISKLFLGLSAAAVIASTAIGVGAATASAATNNVCSVDGTPLGKWGSYLTVNGNKITADFEVKGQNCEITMSLVVFKAPAADGQPLYDQRIYDYKTETFGPGKHQMTENIPDCYYQADLMVGTKADWAEADNSPKRIKFPEKPGDPWPDMGLRDFKMGGDKKCEEPKPTPKPEVKPAATEEPEVLTKTGAGSVLAIGLGVTTLGAAIHQVVMRKLYS